MKAPVCSALVVVSALLGAPCGLWAEVRYNQDIRPIFASRCFKCHGPDLQKAGLDLQSFAAATKNLDDGGPAFEGGFGLGCRAHAHQQFHALLTPRRPPVPPAQPGRTVSAPGSGGTAVPPGS